MNELNISDINFSYDGKHNVLNNINLCIKKGEVTVLAGPNGCGKTTLIKLIFDLLNIQEGDITINGMENTISDCKKQSMYLPGDNILPEFLTGVEYIGFMKRLYGFSESDKLLNDLIKYYSMEEHLNSLIESYSHGMKKKIQLIAAFFIQPDFLVIDETLNGIDIKSKEVSKVLVRKLAKKNKGVILCTHDLEFAEEVGERAILMYEGTICKDIVFKNIENKISLSRIFKDIINFEEISYEI